MVSNIHKTFISRAVQLAEENIDLGGGPFGAVVVKDGVIISEAANQVIQSNDPTAHAEIEAIRKAAEILHTYDLSGCVIYTSSEPCPMCLGAIYWSRIAAVYFAVGIEEADKAGFDDSRFYKDMAKSIESRRLKMIRINDRNALKVFEKWVNDPDKESY